MNRQEEAVWEAHQFFTGVQVPYVIIGGIAVQYWGEPRLTQDVDLTVLAPLGDPESFVSRILTHFTPRLHDALEFALRNRVVLVQSSNGYPLDISLGLPGYEESVMQRAIEYEFEPGRAIRLCSAEDLIIHKAVAGRPQDVRDIEGIVFRQGRGLEIEYVRRWLRDFAEVLENPRLVEHFETPWRRHTSD